MKLTNQKPTGEGGLVANQFKTTCKRIVVWFALNEYLPIKLADFLIQRGGLTHE